MSKKGEKEKKRKRRRRGSSRLYLLEQLDGYQKKKEIIELPEKKGEKEKEKRENGEILSFTFIFGDDDFYLKKALGVFQCTPKLKWKLYFILFVPWQIFLKVKNCLIFILVSSR